MKSFEYIHFPLSFMFLRLKVFLLLFFQLRFAQKGEKSHKTDKPVLFGVFFSTI